MTSRDSIRLDKWLWQARFFKSRTVASRLCAEGRVRIDGIPVDKAHYALRVGNVLTFPQARRIRVVRVRALGERRGPATEARTLYDDLSDAPPIPRPTAFVAALAARENGRR
jgi:ribosome-associated heat shock protein Hsp15